MEFAGAAGSNSPTSWGKNDAFDGRGVYSQCGINYFEVEMPQCHSVRTSLYMLSIYVGPLYKFNRIVIAFEIFVRTA